MAIVDIKFLNSLSYKSAESLLLQEGYIVEEKTRGKILIVIKYFYILMSYMMMIKGK